MLGIIALFMPPNFDQWDDYKLYLLSNNPIKWAIGFIMCTLSAIEFIVWYLIFFQLLREGVRSFCAENCLGFSLRVGRQ